MKKEKAKRETYAIQFLDGDYVKLGDDYIQGGDLTLTQTKIMEIEPQMSVSGKPYVNFHIENSEHKEERFIVTRFDIKKIIYKVVK